MIRTPIEAILIAALGSLPAVAAPLAVGTISADVGYSEGAAFANSSYQTLVQRHLSDHSETVLALVFATPW